MADPVSAEPRNWENDILLKITMPGRELRDATFIKMKRAEERWQRIQAAQSAPQPIVQPVVAPMKLEAVQTQLTDAPKMGETPVQEVVATHEAAPIPEPEVTAPIVVPESQPAVLPAPEVQTAQPEPQPVPEPVVQETPQPVQDVQQQAPVEVDLLSRFVTVKKTAEQEWKQEMVKRTSEPEEKPKIDPTIIVAQQRPKEKKPEFYTNYPGLEMREKYKVWTIEPLKEDAPVARALHDSVNSNKVENFANNIIGGDWAVERLRRR